LLIKRNYSYFLLYARHCSCRTIAT